ncbi:hypothetical protein SKAU_G00011420 [Synaphobranchus kaupii]|uniref:Integrase catalytic domain-containing protein n=1 Tax=Synaphobranchus kaupii TaxID=118154 RepID=A0A9Q1GBA6_SYNKA|nr:hypothetical protein SKAU_G00011420 [Synaphobranchus kaupii]
MDLIGKLATTNKGYKYICVMVDYLTKWPQAYPLRTKCADEVTECIMLFFHQFEAPKRILTDQGKEFVNAVDNSVETVVGEESVSEDIERLDKIKAVVQDNVRKVQESTRRRLKSGAPKPDFKVGDKVLRQNVRSQQRKGGKLEANFLGPYIITALQGKSADLQGDSGAFFPKVNVDHLQHFREEKPRIP